MTKINFTVEQARKVIQTVKPGSHYYFEAQRVLREEANNLLVQPKVNVTWTDE